MIYRNLMIFIFGLSSNFLFEKAEGIISDDVPGITKSFTVSVQRKNEHIGNGAILSKKFILSAAHIFINEGTNGDAIIIDQPHFIVAGDYNAYNNPDNTYISRKKIEKIHVPINYNKTQKYDNDIAVLKLHLLEQLEDLCMNPRIGKVRLPKPQSNGLYESFDNERTSLAGFGYDKFCYDNKSDGSYKECFSEEKKYPLKIIFPTAKNSHVTPRIFSLHGSGKAADNDHGSPIVVTTRSNLTFVIGVLINTEQGSDLIGSATNVTSFMGEINEVIKYKPKELTKEISITVPTNISGHTEEELRK